MFGCTKEQAIGKSDYDFFPQEQSDFFKAKDRASFLLGQTEDISEEPIDSLTLGRRILHTIKIPIFDEQGQPDYLICISEDITHRKQSEIALKESQRFLQTVIDTLPLVVFWKDRQSVYLGCNQKTAIACGLQSPTDIIGKTDYDMPWGKTEAEKYRVDDQLVMESGQAKLGIIETQVREDGTNIWIETNKLPLHDLDGNVIGLLGTYQDITERKQAEIALHQYERMVEPCPDGMAIVDRDYVYRLANQTYLKQNSWQQKQMIGYSLQDVMGEYTFQTIVKPRFDKCLAGKVTDYGDWVYFEKAGNRYVSATYYPYFEIDGTITGVVIINRDVTERRKAEVLLQDSEERLRLALIAANQGLYDLNPQTGITVVSPQYATMLGYSPDEFQETITKWKERMHPDDLERVANNYQAYVNGKLPNYEMEFRQRTKNGEWKWILSIGRIVQWDEHLQPTRMLGIHTDISDRKLAESKLQEERLRLQLALDAAEMGSWGFNLQTGKLFLSDRAQEILGFIPSNVPCDLDTFLAIVYLDDKGRVVQAINDTFATGNPYQIEYRIRRLDGTLRWIAVWGIIHESSNERQLRGVVEDISDRKYAELEREHLLQNLSQLNRELEQANQQLGSYSQTLEQRVEQRTAELQAAQERILSQEKLVFLGTLTAGIAHEIRNPLNFVKNYSEGSIEITQDLIEILHPMLQSSTLENKQFITELIEDLQVNATTIRTHSQRADKIISSMMQHAYTGNGQTTMYPTVLHDLLNEALKLARQN
ncbi:MAG: PAS domain S-box protein, partial [Pseudanabaena sp.]